MKYEQQTKRIAQAVEKLANKSGPNTKYDDDIKRIADALALIIQNGGTIGGGGCQCEEKFKNYYTRDEVDEILIDLSRSYPVILDANHVTIIEGDEFDTMEGVRALDHEGDDITHLVTVSGTVDTDTPGEYMLTYSVTDDKGKSTTVERIVTVEAWNAADYATVLFTDGHLMINEKKSNRAADEVIHGAVTNEYIPWDKNNPETSYVFSSYWDIPWASVMEHSIKTVSAGSIFKPRATTMMFSNARSLTSVNFLNWNTSELKTAESMFYSCTALSNVDLSSWDVSKLENTVFMFGDCYNLNTLDISNWDSSALLDSSYMFSNCSQLETLIHPNWIINKIQKVDGMFHTCIHINALDLSKWSTKNLSSVTEMFSGCSSLRTIYASSEFVVSNVENDYNMFYGCEDLVGGAGTVYKSYQTSAYYARIDNPPSEPGYFCCFSTGWHNASSQYNDGYSGRS